MPTFQTIRIHPALHARLVTEQQSSRTAAAPSAPLDNNNDNDNDNNDNGTAAGDAYQQQHLSVIETPQALLSRNPTRLRLWDPASQTAKPIAMEHVHKLRQQIAHALINSDVLSAGKRKRVYQASLERRRRRRHGEEEEESSCTRTNGGSSSTGASLAPIAIVGFNTALDLLEYELQQRQELSCYNNGGLSTGCATLDRLLSLPAEYRNISTRLDMLTTSDISSSSNRPDMISGIPFGYVTQIAGPPCYSGKTQLALQVIALSSSSTLPPISSDEQHYYLSKEPHDNHHHPPVVACWYLSSSPAVRSYALRLHHLVSCHSPEQADLVLNQTTFCHVSNEYSVLHELALLEGHLEESCSWRQGPAAFSCKNDNANGSDMDKSAEAGIHIGASSSSSSSSGHQPTLVVLDSISSICNSGENSSNERLLQQIAFTIKRLARTFLVAVLVTNGAVQNRGTANASEVPLEEDDDDDDDDNNHIPGGGATTTNTKTSKRLFKPALGRAWSSAADIQLWLDPADNGLVRATLERHPTKRCCASQDTATFRITPAGVKEIVL